MPAPSVRQKLELLEQVGEDFCGMDVNTPIGGSRPVTSVAVLTFDALLTSVAATTTGDFSVVFAGTGDGRLRKVSDVAHPRGEGLSEGWWGPEAERAQSVVIGVPGEATARLVTSGFDKACWTL